MIWAAVSVGTGGKVTITSGKVVGLFAGLLVVHGLLVSLTGLDCIEYNSDAGGRTVWRLVCLLV